MEETDFYNKLKISHEDLEEELEEYPKYCVLLDTKFDNVRRINLFKNDDFINCITHLQKYHPERYFINSAQYKIDLKQSGEYHSIIRQMNYLFFVEFEVKNNTVYITVNMLNAPCIPYDKFCSVELKQVKSLVKEAPIKRKGMLPINTIECNVSDLSIIGDVTQTEVIINIDNYTTCVNCNNLRKYSECKVVNKSGWRCFKCYFRIRLSQCTAIGFFTARCRIKDCLPKLQKHTHFFCSLQHTCYVCHKKFSERRDESFPFHVHYLREHQDITYLIGDGIRIQATPGSYCLLQWSTDTFLLMRYHFTDDELFLAIRSPWITSKLDKYTCSITLSFFGQIEEFRLHPHKNEYDDWRLNVEKAIFKRWHTDMDFIVFVDIQRIPREDGSDDILSFCDDDSLF